MTEDEVRETLSHVPFEGGFGQTARLDAQLSNGRWNRRLDIEHARAVAEIFHYHPKCDRLVDLVVNQERRVFSTSYLHAIQRLLVLEGDEERPLIDEDLRRLQDAYLAITDVASPDESRPGTFDRDYHVALLARLGVHSYTEPMVEAITRAYAIYFEIPRRTDAATMPNYVDPDLWQPDPARTITVHERFIIGMAVLGNTGVFNDELPPPERPTGVPPGYLTKLASDLEDPDPGRLIRAIAASREDYRRQFDREAAGVRENALNSLPFQTRPLLAQAEGGYLMSSTDAVVSWMTRGVHYACLAPLERSGAAHDFLTYVGRLLETYAVELLQDAHRSQPAVLVSGDQPYDRGSRRTPDIAVREGDELVLMEIQSHRFTKDALLNGQTESALDELDRMVVSKARQLSERIDDLRRTSGPAQIAGVDMSDINRIWPVVVVEGGLILNAWLWDHIHDRLGDALKQRGVQPLTIVTMADIEALASYVEQGHRVTLTLRRWKHSAHSRYADFGFFTATKPDMQRRPRARLIQERWDRLTSETHAVFSDAARAESEAGETAEG